MWRIQRCGNSEEERDHEYRTDVFVSNDFRAQPQRSGKRENIHESRRTRGGKKQKGGAQHGKNGAEYCNIGFKPTVDEQYDEECRKNTDNNRRKFDGDQVQAKKIKAKFLQKMIWQGDNISLLDEIRADVARFDSGLHFGGAETAWSDFWQKDQYAKECDKKSDIANNEAITACKKLFSGLFH